MTGNTDSTRPLSTCSPACVPDKEPRRSPGGSFLCRPHPRARYKRRLKCVLTAATRCPPAENPSTPILCGPIPHSAAWNRTSPTVRCASSNAMGDLGTRQIAEIATTRKYDYRSAGVLSRWGIDGHRRPRDPAGHHGGRRLITNRLGVFWSRHRHRIRPLARPYRHLRMSRRWLPDAHLRAQSACRKHNTEGDNTTSKDRETEDW